MRHIVIGDIHGCIEEFKELLERVGYDKEKDIGISLGDLVDRGPDPAGCLELALDQNLILIAANHEDRLLRWRQREEAIAAGVIKENDVNLKEVHQYTLKQIEAHPRRVELWRYIQNHRLVYEFEAGGIVYHCVHGGYNPALGINTPKKQMIRMRGLDPETYEFYKSNKGKAPKGSVFWAKLWQGPQVVIFGHSVFDDVMHFQSAIGIDTGACFGNKLSALIIEEDGSRQAVSVAAKKVYTGRKYNVAF